MDVIKTRAEDENSQILPLFMKVMDLAIACVLPSQYHYR